jgi:hypothetical protein
MTPTKSNLVTAVQHYIERFVTFQNPDHAFAVALWTVATYFWPNFDTFPYLIITSSTKRSGKTRLSEVVSFASANPMMITGMTAATVYRSIGEFKPTMFMDEAEGAVGAAAKRRAADVMTATLNSGYRKGQTIPRMAGNKLVQFESYCPKCFILIGDPYDTLRDRSIVVTLQRGEPKERFFYEAVKTEGNALGEQIKAATDDTLAAVLGYYMGDTGLPFLTDRDEEIWNSLFSVCAAFAPDRLKELERVAVDMATEKTAEARRYVNLMGAESEAEDDEYSQRLMTDLLSVFPKGAKHIFTTDALVALKEINTAPWRKYRGAGLSPHDLGNLTSRHGVTPGLVRIGGKVLRGYKRGEVEKAVKLMNGEK